MQTCYRRVPTIEEVGDRLKLNYGGAIRVNPTTNEELVNVNPSRPPPGDENIVYKDISPNFCTKDTELGVVGVAERICDPNPNKPNACSTLCCDHGHYTTTHVRPVENCRFVWCCDIVCEYTGNVTVTEYRCN